VKPKTLIQGISYLAIATGQEIGEERLTIYVHQLSDLRNEALWAETVKRLANTSKFMPTVAEIRACYREQLLAYRPATAIAAGPESGWEHAGGGYDDCLGSCGRKHRLADLMARNGYCRDCVPPETVTRRMAEIAPHFRRIGDAA
jgi:hypothetical protein